MTDDYLATVIAGERYVNLKTKGVYQVIHIGRHTETDETFVLYVSTHPELIRHKVALFLLAIASRLLDNGVWVRPYELFKQKFIEKV